MNSRKLAVRFLFAAALVSLTVPVHAGTQDSMILRGSVAPILEIDLQPEPIATKLDLTQEAKDIKVAGVFERANDPDGYVVTFSSANAGVLKASQANNTDAMPYTLQYAGQSAFSLSDGPVSFNHKSRTGAEGVTQRLGLSYPEKWIAADTYEDTVTATIAAL
jgi:hypothetical protein